MRTSRSGAVKHILLADIGGTHARFAVLHGGVLGPVRSLDVHAHATLAGALRFLLAGQEGGASLDAAILALAGPVMDGRCALTNSSWVADAATLANEFGIPSVRIVNDQEAAAWSLPHFAPSDTRRIGPDTPVSGAPLALVSPGTGLGVACLVSGPPGARVIASEGGHVSLAAETTREEAVIGVLRRQFGHVSAERALSGDGLVNLYHAAAEIDGVGIVPRTAADITRAALNGACVTCRKALDTFCGLLGGFAGDVALLFGARGGVFIGGGIAPHIVEHLERTEFRRRFEAKGRLGRYLASIPVRIVVRPDPAFLGLAALAQPDRHQCHA
ncbi:MAG: glucokinase [Rhodospirillales bacterium]|nr:glucokinase [Rhodospirillales bacterium]